MPGVRTVETDVGPINIVSAPDSSAAELWDWVHARPHMLALDCETNAQDSEWHPNHRVRTTQISDGQTGWVIQTEKPGMIDVTRTIVRSHPLWTAHYAQSEVRFLGNGVSGALDLTSVDPHVADTQVMLGYFDPRTVTTRNKKERIDPRIPRSRGLKDTVARIFSTSVLSDAETAMHKRFIEIAPTGFRTKNASKKYGFEHIGIDDELYLRYGGLDAITEAWLFYHLERELRKMDLWPIVVKDLRRQWHADLMTFRGQLVDGPYAKWLGGQFDAVVHAHTAYLSGYGIPPSCMGGSVGNAFHAMGVSSSVRTKTGESWNKVALKEIAAAKHEQAAELATSIRTVRMNGKYRSSYVTPMLDALRYDGRVHCQFRIFGALPGRNAASKPANQQLPKDDTRCRAAYEAPKGWVLISSDFHQGEPRVMAGLSGDQNLRTDLLAGNLNDALAARAYGSVYKPDDNDPGTPSFGMYKRAKAGFLARCYGGATRKLSETLNVDTATMAAIEHAWDARYPDLAAFADKANRTPGGIITLESGRRVPLWDRWVYDQYGLRDTGKPSRLALNYFAQGTQRDLLMEAMDRLIEWGWSWALWFLVHDEILLCVPEELAEKARLTVEAAMTMDFHGVPITADAEIRGRTWMPQPNEFDLTGIEDAIAEEDDDA